MSKEQKSQMRVFMVARSPIGQLKLNRKFDADLVALAVGWLMQEQAKREENRPPKPPETSR